MYLLAIYLLLCVLAIAYYLNLATYEIVSYIS